MSTFAAFGPQAQVEVGHRVAGHEGGRLQVGQLKDVLRHIFDVVTRVAEDSSQRHSSYLDELLRFEY